MRVTITGVEGGPQSLWLDAVRVPALFSEHDLRDLEFTLAQRRAMSRRCPETHGEHTCGNAPGHRQAHLCRACPLKWSGSTMG